MYKKATELAMASKPLRCEHRHFREYPRKTLSHSPSPGICLRLRGREERLADLKKRVGGNYHKRLPQRLGEMYSRPRQRRGTRHKTRGCSAPEENDQPGLSCEKHRRLT